MRSWYISGFEVGGGQKNTKIPKILFSQFHHFKMNIEGVNFCKAPEWVQEVTISQNAENGDGYFFRWSPQMLIEFVTELLYLYHW